MAKTRARSCTGKVKIATKAEAVEVYFARRRKGASMITYYNCKFCDGYHIGHKPKPRRSR